jgi:hypothetical protein
MGRYVKNGASCIWTFISAAKGHGSHYPSRLTPNRTIPMARKRGVPAQKMSYLRKPLCGLRCRMISSDKKADCCLLGLDRVKTALYCHAM